MKDFKIKYEQFTEYMADYMMQHQDYWDMLLEIKKNRRGHRLFCQDLFIIWLKDPSKIDWYMENTRLSIEK